MGILDSLLGGSQGKRAQDFMQRFDQGRHDQISAEEVEQHYGKVSSAMGSEDYQSAAEQALSRLSPEQRAELVGHLQQQARAQDVNFPGLHQAEPQDTRGLAGVFSSMHAEQPGLLQRLLGGGADPSRPYGTPVGKVVLAGIAAVGLRKLMKR
jgi:hypothetical protein